MEHVHCNLCGADMPRPWLEVTDRFSGEPFHLVICSQCGLIYLSPRPTTDEISAHYPDEYEAYQLDAEAMSMTQAWHSNRMWGMQTKFLNKHHSLPGRLLDIGCATGEFLNTARQVGWEVYGLEMIAEYAQRARDRFNLDVIRGTLESVELPDNTYDAITMWDVLEHLPDPRYALDQCHRLLKPNGILVFSIPNLSSFDRYLFGTKWIGWDAPRHFTLYTRETLWKALKMSGFSLVSSKCLLGGKGTFLLSMDNVLAMKKIARTIKNIYPLISALLFPYRQVSYLVGRGPILAVVAHKLEAA